MVRKIKAGFEVWDRPINKLAYFTDDNGKPMLFDSKEEAEKYIRSRGYTEFERRFIAFQYEDGEWLE